MSSKETFTKKLQGKLPKNLKKTFKKKLGGRIKAGTRLGSNLTSQISSQIAAQMPTDLSQRLNEQAHKATRAATQAALQTAQIAAETAQMAADTAKGGLDQVLIGLEHRGFNLKESQDIAQKVGRKVLERAEAVRAQIAASPLSPAWLREVTLKNAKVEPVVPVAAETAPITHMTSTAEATASEPAEFMQPDHTEAQQSLAFEDETPVGVQSDELDATMKPAKKSKKATGLPKKAAAKMSPKTPKASKASAQPAK